MLNFFGVGGIFIALTTGFMAVLMFAKRSRAAIAWGLFSSSAALWGFGVFFITKSLNETDAVLWWTVAYIGVILIPVSLNLFVFYFLEFKGAISKMQLFLVCLTGLIFLGLNFFDGYFIDRVRYVFNRFYYIYPPTASYSLFVVFFFFIVAYNLARLCSAYKYSSDELFRKRLSYIIIGLLIGFIGGGLSFLPVFGVDIYPYANFSIAIGAALVGYAILRHNLLDIKIIATEIFAVLVPLVVLVDAFVFTEKSLLPYKIALFLGVSVFSVFLVRGVFKEVEAKEALMRLNQAKTDFLNIASHQLRTPISVIKGVVSMMKEGDWDKLPEEKKKMFFEGLWHKSNKLESIVNDILNAAEMSNEKYKVIDKRAAWIDAKELFDKVFEETQAEAAEREIELKVNLPAGALPKIYGQVEYLKEAIGNLVDNAIKYTPSTKADFDSRDTRAQKGIVELGLVYDKDNAIISVRDNGIGVPQAEMSKLFAKFYRAQNARNMYTDGSGLGLFIVKEIVEGHNGRVWGKSEVGKGATFYISLPLNPPKEADVRKHIIEGEVVANGK